MSLNHRLIPFAVIALLGLPWVQAEVISLAPLVNPSFEADSLANEAQSSTAQGWSLDTTGGAIARAVIYHPGATYYPSSHDSGSFDGTNVLVLKKDTSGNRGSASQALRGDLGSGLEILQINELAGTTIRVTLTLGRSKSSGWGGNDVGLIVGIQEDTTAIWAAQSKIDTGSGWTEAGISANLTPDSFGTFTTDLVIPAGATGGLDALLAFKIDDSYTPNGAEVAIDDLKVEVLAPPLPGDTSVFGGAPYSVGASIVIAGTSEQDLFRHELFASRLRVEFGDIPAGQITIELGAAELYFTQPGKRVFSVSADGLVLEAELDLFDAAGGKNIALVRTYTISHAGGSLKVDLDAIVNNAKFSFIRLRESGGGLLGEVIARDVPETLPFPPVSSEDELVFFNADHAPVGAHASLLYGEPASGGLMIASGRSDKNIPSSGVLIASIQDGIRHLMPFVSPGSGSTAYPANGISRRIRAATDRWDCGDGLSWVHYSTPWPMRDFATATTAERERFCLPATWIEFTVDNSSGTSDRDLLFSLREPNSTPAGWGDHHGYVTSGSTFTGSANQTAIAALSARSERLTASEVSTLLGVSGANSAIRFRTPPGEIRSYKLIVAHHSTETFTAAGDFTATYYYRTLFPTMADVIAAAAANFDAAKEWSLRLDSHLDQSGQNEFRRFLSGHALHSYRYSTIFLETSNSDPLWLVSEGGYAYLNTLDLTIDHLFYELAMHPWTVTNALDLFVDRYSYTDTVKNPDGTVVPGGISFTHDMGLDMSLSPAGTSSYESPARHNTFMSQEQLQNWILCASITYTYTGDAAWLAGLEGTFQQALVSMQVRDDAVPASRDGITTYITTKGTKDEITTYDSLDPALKQVRNNLYIAVKSWAAYVAMEKVFTDLGDPTRANESATAAQATATSIVARWNVAGGYIPAVFDGTNTSRIIPAVEGLIYPYRMGLYEALSPTGPYGPLIQTLRNHLDGALTSGICLDATTGAWKLSSTSTNTWQSKVYLNQYVAQTILGINDDRVVGPVDAIHADFQVNRVGTAGWCDQLNSNSGTDRGSRHYPRGVTSALWWMNDEIGFFEQGFTKPYSDWAASKDLDSGNNGFDVDADLDGVANGIEWVLGGNPLVADAAEIQPRPTADPDGILTLVFKREASSIGQVLLTVEWDTDLSGGFAHSIPTDVAIPPSGDNPSVRIDKEPTTDLVTVSIPAANAAAGRIFARIRCAPTGGTP